MRQPNAVALISLITLLSCCFLGRAGLAQESRITLQASSSAYSSPVRTIGNDGSLNYSYTFQLPKHRGKFRPQLILRYNSRGRTSPVGYGWTITQNYIERNLRASPDGLGVPRQELWMNSQIGNGLLVFDGELNYRLEVTDSYLVVKNLGPSLDLNADRIPSPGAVPRLIVPQNSHHDCKILCSRHQNCEAYAYGPDNAGVNQCVLMYDVAPAIPNVSNRVSGVRFTTFQATDAIGNQYFFDKGVDRLGNPCAPDYDSMCVRWYLTKVIDVDGNTVEYRYLQEQGASLLVEEIFYNTYDPGNTTKSDRIGDTGHYATKIRLDWQNEPHPYVEVIAGGKVEHRKRLSSVEILLQPLNDPGGSKIVTQTYRLTYEESFNTHRSLLRQITTLGKDYKPLPSTEFLYAAMPDYFLGGGTQIDYLGNNDADPFCPQGETCPRISRVAAWLDLDGDKRPDLVWGGEKKGIRWAQNKTVAGAETLRFGNVEIIANSLDFPGIVSFTYPTGDAQKAKEWGGDDDIWRKHVLEKRPPVTKSRLADFNGDGKLDLIKVHDNGKDLLVSFGTVQQKQFGYAPPVTVTTGQSYFAWQSALPKQENSQPPQFGLSYTSYNETIAPLGTYADLIDMTGDGILDYVISAKTGQSSYWYVYPGYHDPNKGWAFSNIARRFEIETRTLRRPDGTTDLIDMNGDGLLDFVETHGGHWFVRYNTGFEFQWPSDLKPWADIDETIPAISKDFSHGIAGMFADVNNDGLPDYIMTQSGDPYNCHAPTPCEFIVTLNEGFGFRKEGKLRLIVSEFASFRPYPYSEYHSVGTQPLSLQGLLIDLNADGLLDHVSWSPGLPERWTFVRGWNPNHTTYEEDALNYIAAPSPSVGYTFIEYASSTQWEDANTGNLYSVVTKTTEGESVTEHWYANSSASLNWHDPSRLDVGGFLDTWQRGPDGVITYVKWSDKYPYIGRPEKIQKGTKPPDKFLPGSGVQSVFYEATYEWAVKNIKNSACPDPKSNPYPVIPFLTAAKESRVEADLGRWSAITKIACHEVDTNGNILGKYTDADDKRSNDEIHELTSFDNHSVCKICPVGYMIVQPNEKVLRGKYFRYDHDLPRNRSGNGHLAYVEEWESYTAEPFELKTVTRNITTYNGNGTIQSVAQTDPAVTVSYDYAPYQIGVRRTITNGLVGDQPRSLIVEYEYDEIGLPSRQTGPYVEGQQPTSHKYVFYDGFGRLIAEARAPMTDGKLKSPTVVYQYDDFAEHKMFAIRTYRFAAPITVSPYDIPLTNDVSLSIAYYDNKGRLTEVRERLGNPQSGSAHTDAQITQHLSGYLVSKAIVYDAADRIEKVFEPYYSAKSGPVHYKYSVLLDPLPTETMHGTRFQYDERNRVTCVRYEDAYNLYADIPECVSNFSESRAYRRASRIIYNVEQPDATPYLSTMVIPAELNLTSQVKKGYRSLSRRDGQVEIKEDAYGNATNLSFDNLGQLIGATRIAGTHSQRSDIAYDLMGRITKLKDPYSERHIRYFGNGTIKEIDYGQSQIQYSYDSLGRLSQVRQATITNGTWQIDESLTNYYEYDISPFPLATNGSGRLTKAHNQATTIAFGYSEDGAVTSWQQTFPGEPAAGPFTINRTIGHDGRLLSTSLSGLAAENIAYKTEYDSAGRPVRLRRADRSNDTVWEALPKLGLLEESADRRGYNYDQSVTNTPATCQLRCSWNSPRCLGFTFQRKQNDEAQCYLHNIVPEEPSRGNPDFMSGLASHPQTGAYDALNRILDFTVDQGLIRTRRTFSSVHNLLTSLDISSNDASFYRAENLSYTGAALNSYVDAIRQTRDSFEYDLDGRLQRVVQEGPTGNSDERYSYFLSKSFNPQDREPSFWNLESLTFQQGQDFTEETYEYPSDRPDAVRSIRVKRNGVEQKFTYEYDRRGFVQKRIGGDETYSYDAFGNLLRVTRPTVGSEIIKYDPFGKLTWRTVIYPSDTASSTTTIYYVGQDATIIVKKKGAEEPVTETAGHILVGQTRVASVTPTSLLYYHQDRLGSIIATTLDGGRHGRNYRYGHYGKDIAVEGEEGEGLAAESELGFTGALRLSQGLLHLNARVYDPQLRRFLQPDTEDGLRYTYAAGDPANLVDPSGHRPRVAGQTSRNRFGEDYGLDPYEGLPAGLYWKLEHRKWVAENAEFFASARESSIFKVPTLDEIWAELWAGYEENKRNWLEIETLEREKAKNSTSDSNSSSCVGMDGETIPSIDNQAGLLALNSGREDTDTATDAPLFLLAQENMCRAPAKPKKKTPDTLEQQMRTIAGMGVWILKDSPMGKLKELSFITFAYPFAQAGATVGEISLLPFLPFRLAYPEKFGELGKGTLWGVVHSAFPPLYSHTLGLSH